MIKIPVPQKGHNVFVGLRVQGLGFRVEGLLGV